jgi:outer membrane immunogenic protein
MRSSGPPLQGGAPAQLTPQPVHADQKDYIMKKIVVIAALLAGVAATPAMAQETAAPGNFHITGIVGYDAPDGDVDETTGVVYGVSAGYDFNIGRNLVVGPEVELTSSSTDECASGINRAGDQLCLEAGRDIYVGGRVGLRFGNEGRHIAYVGGGYTNAQFRLTYDANLAGNTGDFDVKEDSDGWRVKGGVEFGLGRNIFTRAEYRYSSYEDDVDRHQVVAGIGIRF